MTDIREEFARIVQSLQKTATAYAENVGWNHALERAAEAIRSHPLPSVCGGEGWRETEISRHFVNELGRKVSIYLTASEEKGVLISVSGERSSSHWEILHDEATVLREVLCEAAASPSPPPVSARAESIRNAIAAMENSAKFLDYAMKQGWLPTGTFTLDELQASLAALKREVGSP
jgi:hypothetical protein